MATPIPFRHKTGFTEPSTSEIARQVKRMQELSKTSRPPVQGPRMPTKFGPASFTNAATTAKPGAQGFLQQALAGLGAYTPLLGIPLGAGLGLYADSKKTGNETPFVSGRGADFGSGPHHLASMRTYADGTPVRPARKASGTKITIDGKTYDTGYHAKEIAELRKKYPGGGNAAQSTVQTDQTTRVTPEGVVQKGTDMSGANTLLRKMGIDTVQYGQFESNHLPGEQETAGKPQKTNVDAVMGGETPETATSHSAGWTVDANNENFSTKETKLVESGEIQVSNPAQLGTRERYRQEFLLDRGDKTGEFSESMAGLRAAEASKGLLYASGSYWQEDGKGGFTKIDKATAKRIKRGDTHAQQFATDRIKETQQNLQTDTGKKSYENTDLDASMPTPQLVKSLDDITGDATPSTGDNTYGNTSINASMRIPSQTTYGNTEFTGVMPKAADMPSQQELSPIDTGDIGMAERMKTLREKMANGDFNRYLK